MGVYIRAKTGTSRERLTSLEIRVPGADALARELASAACEDVDTAVMRAIEERLARMPRQLAVHEKAAVAALFDRLAQLPVRDSRSPEEIIGYGPNGLPS